MSVALPARRFAWVLLIAAALFARGLAPDGWMPSAKAAGQFELMLCSGMGGTPTVAAGHGHSHHPGDHDGGGSHPCAFAGVAVADTAPPPLVITPPIRLERPRAPATAFDVLPGRGLAAPPPPATGPPARA